MAGSVGEHTFVFQLTPLRAEPDHEAEQVSQVLPGEPLAVEAGRDGWLRVVTAYRYPGWLHADAVGGGPDPHWLEPIAASPLAFARSLLGAPYLWGGMTAAGIDCSGLVHMSYRAVGRLVPRDADEQEAVGRAVAELRAGDLISYGDESADHIAFWSGDGRIVHATQREGLGRVLEEVEPDQLRARRRATFAL